MESIEINNLKEFGYGSNSNQTAYIAPVQNGIDYEILSREKDLNYTEILNLSETLKILGEFFDVHCAVSAKETIINCAALGNNSFDAFTKIIDSNPISVINSVLGFSKNVDFESAKQIKAIKAKIVIAPEFDKEAFRYLLDTDVKLVKINTPLHEIQGFCEKDIKVTPFGILLQEQNLNKLSKDNFQVVSELKPETNQVQDAIFGWKVAKHLKSRAVIVAKDSCAKAIVQAHSDNITAVEHAMDIACENTKDAVLVFDGSIDNTQVINSIIQCRIGVIVETGISAVSKEVLKLINKYGICLIHTKLENNKY